MILIFQVFCFSIVTLFHAHHAYFLASLLLGDVLRGQPLDHLLEGDPTLRALDGLLRPRVET